MDFNGIFSKLLWGPRYLRVDVVAAGLSALMPLPSKSPQADKPLCNGQGHPATIPGPAHPCATLRIRFGLLPPTGLLVFLSIKLFVFKLFFSYLYLRDKAKAFSRRSFRGFYFIGSLLRFAYTIIGFCWPSSYCHEGGCESHARRHWVTTGMSRTRWWVGPPQAVCLKNSTNPKTSPLSHPQHYSLPHLPAQFVKRHLLTFDAIRHKLLIILKSPPPFLFTTTKPASYTWATSCVLALTIWSLPFGLSAQTTLQGQVFHAEDATPLPQVEVLVLPAGNITFTNKQGRFQLDELTPGQHELVLYRYGFATIQTVVNIPTDSTLTFQLQPLQNNLSEILVAEARESVYATTRLRAVEGTAIYAGKKNEVVLLDQLTFNAAANNARQLYSQVSGLNIYESNDAGLQLNIGGRGLDPSRSAGFNTRQNGYDISADVLGYPESYYTPPAEALERIEVIRGAASLQYGTQFGGLVNFIFKQADSDTPLAFTTRQTVGSNALFTSFSSLTGTLGKFSYYTYYHRKQGDGFRPNSGFHSDHAFARIAYQIGPRTSLRAEYTYLHYLAQQAGGLTDAQFYTDPNFSNRARNWFQVDWNLLALRLEHQFSSRTDLSIQFFGLDASRSALGFRTNRVSQIDDPESPRDYLLGTFRNGGAEARLLHRYALNGQPAILLVGSKYYQSDNSAIQGPGSASTAPDFQLATTDFPDYPDQSSFRFPNQNMALFAEHIFYLSDQLTLTPGMRYEYIKTASEGYFQRLNFDLAGNVILRDTFTDNRTLPRNLFLFGLGASYKPQERLEFYGNFSQNYRSVTFNDIRVVNPSFQVDPNIEDERGFNADLGLRGRNDRFAFDANIFGLLYDNRLGEVLRPETRTTADGTTVETGRIIRFRGNIGRAFIYGWESLLETSLLKAQANQQQDAQLHAFLNLALIHSQYLDSEIAGVTDKQVEFIPLLNLKTGLRFSYRQLRASLQYAYLSEQFTDATNAPQNLRDNQSGIRGSIPAYGVMDFSLSYSWKNFTVEGGINNVLNQSYFTRRATGYPGPGIIPSAPRTGYMTVMYTGFASHSH